MAGPFQRRISIALAASAASFAAWTWIPGTALDRAAFSIVCRSFINPPYFVSGEGKPASPWQLRSFSDSEHIDPKHAPVVVSLGDDPDNIFQASPQSPLDLALILSNFQRHGVQRPAIPAVLAWDQADVTSLTSLELKLASFHSVTMAAPLARGAVPELMPPAFRRASLRLDKVIGDTTVLPVVNRLPVSGVILGDGENCTAGFQSIDSEKNSVYPPLLARWDDRVVLAFPLVAAMQHLAVSPDQIEVSLGEWVKLGAKGPTLPIDSFGRLIMPLPKLGPRMTLKAEDLIDAAPGIIPDPDKALIMLRDDHSAADPATRGFSRSLASITTAITSDAGLQAPVPYQRPDNRTEAIILTLTALVLAWISGRPRFQQTVGFLSVAGLCLIIQWIGAGSAQLWLPGIATLSGILSAGLLSRILPDPIARPRREPSPETTSEAQTMEGPKSQSKTPAKRAIEDISAPAAEAQIEAPAGTPAKQEPKMQSPAPKKTAKKTPPNSSGPKGKKRRN